MKQKHIIVRGKIDPFKWPLLISVLIIGVSLVWGVHQVKANDSIEHVVTDVLEEYLPRTYQIHYQNIVWDKKTTSKLVWGYTNKHSVKPGESFHILLSTDVQDKKAVGHIEIYRIGYYGATDRKLYYKSGEVSVSYHDIPPASSAIGALWPSYFSDINTQNWQSGYYTIDFVNTSNQREQDIAYIVVTPPVISGDILVKLSTNTYQAYNMWGGSNLYESRYISKKGKVVSFDRPTPTQFYTWEYYYVLWLEKLAYELGVTVHYASDFDVHSNAQYTENYRIFISLGHDEYMTMEEFNHIYDRIFKLGKNTLFLSANSAYWQIRYADLNIDDGMKKYGRLMVCYKSMNDPITQYYDGDPTLKVTARFRDEYRYPETMLMGVSYQYYFSPKKDITFPYYANTDAKDFYLFKNTGYKKGTEVGDIIGHEWDNTDPKGDGKRYWDKEKSKLPLLPLDKIKVIFSGPVIDKKGRKGKAETVFFQSDAGAKVLSAGTFRWSWGLGKPGFEKEEFKQFNTNLIRDFLGMEF
jgi:N,N-dimethylformamidase beta subunit-like protein